MMKPAGKIKGLFLRGVNRIGIGQPKADRPNFAMIFDTFQKTLALNNRILELIADMGDKLSGDYVFDIHYIQSACRDISESVHNLVFNLNTIAPGKYKDLFKAFQRIDWEIQKELEGRPRIPKSEYTIGYNRIDRDSGEIAGAKNANLGEIKNILGLVTPEGFAIAATAFEAFIAHNQLWDKIKEISDAWNRHEISSTQASESLQNLILKGSIPPLLTKAMNRAIGQLSRIVKIRKPRLAVRSSAWKEDGKDSFAGQYTTLLNQSPEDLAQAYKIVLASAYSSSVLEYRRQKGFSACDSVVAVGCQTMVNADVSGVLYTVDPLEPTSGFMLVTSVWGLGAPVVDGAVSADRFLLNRHRPYLAKSEEIAVKKERLIMHPEKGTIFTPNDTEVQNQPCLNKDQLKQLAETAMVIERHFKSPQDIEFAFDEKNRLVILQARPLHLERSGKPTARDLSDVLKKYQVCFEGKGDIVQRGVGIGKVFRVNRDEDLDVFPAGSILVAKYTSPRYAKVINKAAGIITDVGSATGHMATIAREFRVPTIVNAQIATRLLETGQEITLDAEEKKIYCERVSELEDYHLTQEPIEETFEYRLLRRVLKMISLLNLLDPTAKDFKPSGCRTFHDITRFVHEKAVEELINQNFRHSQDENTAGGKLKLALPLDLFLIDIGNGLIANSGGPIVTPDQIASIPMAAFVHGLNRPGAWNTDPMAVDFSSFMSSLTRTFSPVLADPRHIGQNLAVISKSYAHINLRLGYHFNIIDVYIDEDINSNYAYFRFLGGVTDLTRRSRRATLLSEILVQNDFRVEVRGDLVVARIKKLTVERMKAKVYLLGVLVSFARQLDVHMDSDRHVDLYVDKFKELIHFNHNQMTQGEIRYEQ